MESTKIVYDAGIRIGAGTDNFISNEKRKSVTLHEELMLLVKAGLSNIDALRAATIVNAEIVGEKDKIGTVEKGKLANLVILNSDPLMNIKNTRDVKYVIKRGILKIGISTIEQQSLLNK